MNARLLLIVGCLALMPLPALSQSISTEEKVRYLLEMGDFEKGLETGFQAMRPGMLAQIQSISPKITLDVASHVAEIASDEFKAMKTELLVFATDFYRRSFSQEEIDAMYDFYRTSIGAQIGRKANVVLGQLMTEVQPFVVKQLVPKLKTRLSQDQIFLDAIKP